jgi:hypothetical protein
VGLVIGGVVLGPVTTGGVLDVPPGVVVGSFVVVGVDEGSPEVEPVVPVVEPVVPVAGELAAGDWLTLTGLHAASTRLATTTGVTSQRVGRTR